MNELALRDDTDPASEITHAGAAASACKAIVTATAQNIGGRKYVRVEGWQAIAIAHGCVASSRDVERTETGYRAIGEVRRRDTGTVIAQAEGFVGDDEPTWAKRAEYARRAMAQTRAISRACRSCFAHVVVMMAAGLETTPAEEIPHDDPAPLRTVPPSDRAISEKQGKRLWAIMKGAGHEVDTVKSWLQATYGIDSSKQIARDTYEAICARLQDPTPLDELPQPPDDDQPEDEDPYVDKEG